MSATYDRPFSRIRSLTNELGAFAVVGALSFVVDIGLFQVLYAYVGTGPVTAKLGSTIASMSLAYLAHRHWTFGDRERTGVRREYLLFAVINGATLALGVLVVGAARYGLGHEGAVALQVANVLSIGLGTVVRFIAYRNWVFPETVTPSRDPRL